MGIANHQSGIYAITNSVNGKMYVGSAVRFGKRWVDHRQRLRRGKHHSVILQSAWNKYAEEDFTFDVIEFVDRARLIEREQVWLDFFKPAYNVAKCARAPGAGMPQSEESRLKRSRSSTGRITSVETRAKLAAAATGRIYPAEVRSRISSANLGRIVTAETRLKLSLAAVGRPNHMQGRKHSAETRTKMRAGQALYQTRRRGLNLSEGTPSVDSPDNASKKNYWWPDMPEPPQTRFTSPEIAYVE